MTSVTTGRSAISRDIGHALTTLSAIDDWGTPTNLRGWSVADLAAHLVFGQALQADAWRQLHPGGAPLQEADAADPPDRIIDAIRANHDAFMTTLGQTTDHDLGRELTLPYGTLPAALVLQIATMEAGVHAYDLAVITGPATLSDDAVAAAIALVPTMCLVAAGSASERPQQGTAVRLQSDGIDLILTVADGGWQPAGPAEAQANVTISGSPDELALFVLGRIGVDGVTVTGEQRFAEQFKHWFPGP